MREEKILADAKDLNAFIKKAESINKSLAITDASRKLEEQLLNCLQEGEATYHLKELIENCLQGGLKDVTVNKLKTIINLWSIKNWIKRQSLEYAGNHIRIALLIDKKTFRDKQETRHLLARRITEYLYKKSADIAADDKEDVLVEFSVQELKDRMESEQGMFTVKTTIDDIEDSLFYLSRIGAITIEGGFLVSYNRLTINRLEKNNRIQYKETDYEKLRLFYQQKVQQIHIVGEYAKRMIRNYNEALQFVDDYFRLNYASFLSKYFPGSRQNEIKRTLTPEKFERLFGALSPAQLEIIADSANQYIVVAAGPGSGKTRVLVHKLASLLLAEDVKHEQLLMLTFSRAAATEFKKRLMELIGNAAAFIEIKTFHSYCFDLLGRIGNLSEVDNVLKATVEKIRTGEIEMSRITKTVLVVDEAQDMNKEEYELVKALMEQNEEMRVILVGDDDQNIYGFRKADAAHMQQLITEKAAKKYELVENYRSKKNIVELANQWAATISRRLKTAPCYSVQKENGSIKITGYSSKNLVVPLTTQIRQAELTGSTCVLTKTNEEANLIAGMLTQMQLPAKLIQTNDGFNLANLFELRYFTELINNSTDNSIIPDEDWQTAKQQLLHHIAASDKKQMVNGVIKAFEAVNPARKYKSDWNSFLTESKLEDFINIDAEMIYVSTIHKAKGKEFNNLFIELNHFSPTTDEAKRELYVAITRAKSNLQIHYTGNYLRSFAADDLLYSEDNAAYPEPQQIVLYLTHRDVQLWHFEFVQYKLKNLYSGSTLTIMEQGLGNEKQQQVLKYSKQFTGLLNAYFKKGFRIAKAKVNFMVWWKDEEKENEVLVVLPRLLLVR